MTNALKTNKISVLSRYIKWGERVILFIKTLGGFDVSIGEKTLVEESNRSYRLIKLLQYFITFKNKNLLPDTIIDNLYQDNDSPDPKNMIRGQIFRLRQVIKKLIPEESKESDYLNITFKSGYYCLEVGDKVVVDKDEFEELIIKGDQLVMTDTISASNIYSKAMDMYKGDYLGDSQYEMWLVPVRNYYRRLYLKVIFNMVELLKEKGKHEEIMIICENAIAIEPFEEALHIYLIESMLKLGKIKNAMSHFEHITEVLEKENGTKLSPGLKEIERKIQHNSNEKSNMDIVNMRDKLELSVNDGPLLCDAEYFKFLYNLHNRKRNPIDASDFISLITLNPTKKTPAANRDLIESWSDDMTKVLTKTLRKGDVFSFWNDTQILALLPDVKDNGTSSIEQRIYANLRSLNQGNPYDLKIRFVPIDANFSLS